MLVAHSVSYIDLDFDLDLWLQAPTERLGFFVSRPLISDASQHIRRQELVPDVPDVPDVPADVPDVPEVPKHSSTRIVNSVD
jgi:hypothetical protein